MSSLGPTIIFDKSLLQSLNEDESVWLDAFYHSIITPLFYVETLADLDKEIKFKTAEEIVGYIANKVPEMSSSPNIHHRELCIGNLLGHEVDNSRRPIIREGRSFIINEKPGVIFDEFEETKAFQRWRKHQFLEIERDVASLWRSSLSEFNYDYFLKSIEQIKGTDFKKPKSLEESFSIASDIIQGCGHRYKTFQLIRDLLNINNEIFKKIISIWNKKGMIPLSDFAPYAAHVLKVDIFFILSTSNGLISRERKSNRADIAYLYYLPFSNIFTSSDGLHKRIVPFFLESDQRFIYGPDFKDDLSKLDKYFFDSKSEEEKQAGVFSFAWYPPDNPIFLTTRMWDDMRPCWRIRDVPTKPNANQKLPDGLKEYIKNAYKEISKQKSMPIQNIRLENANDVIIKRLVRARKGKWQLLSNEIINSSERVAEDDTDV